MSETCIDKKFVQVNLPKIFCWCLLISMLLKNSNYSVAYALGHQIHSSRNSSLVKHVFNTISLNHFSPRKRLLDLKNHFASKINNKHHNYKQTGSKVVKKTMVFIQIWNMYLNYIEILKYTNFYVNLNKDLVQIHYSQMYIYGPDYKLNKM